MTQLMLIKSRKKIRGRKLYHGIHCQGLNQDLIIKKYFGNHLLQEGVDISKTKP
jgi:hypothetical protein